MDLEDKFLKEDVRREQDPEDLRQDSAASDDESEQSGAEDSLANDFDPPMSDREAALRAELGYGVDGRLPGQSYRSGAKGVLAEYRKEQEIQRRMKQADEVQALASLMSTMGVYSNAPSTSYSATASERKDTIETAGGSKPEPTETSDTDSDEEEWLALRRKRLLEMKAQAAKLRPKFGDVRFLEDKFELPEEVDNAGKDVVVVVHLTENVLEALAKKHQHVKFMEITATEASSVFRISGLPTLIVYKTIDAIGRAPAPQDVEELLGLDVLDP